MIHVDDFVLYVGTKQFWDGVFLKKQRSRPVMNKLEGPGSSIKFLRRKLVETENGLVLMPGTTTLSKELSMRLRRHLTQHICRRFQVMPAFNLQTTHQD